MQRLQKTLRTPQFEYGPLARGCYIALICLIPVTAIALPGLLGWHVLLVLFLGLGLRPLLEWSGKPGAPAASVSGGKIRACRKTGR